MTPVVVPEAPMYERDGSILREDHIGCSGKVLPVKAIPKSHVEKTAAYLQFQLGVLGSNRRHHATSGLFIHRVCHRFTLRFASVPATRKPTADRGFGNFQPAPPNVDAFRSSVRQCPQHRAIVVRQNAMRTMLHPCYGLTFFSFLFVITSRRRINFFFKSVRFLYAGQLYPAKSKCNVLPWLRYMMTFRLSAWAYPIS